MLVLAAGMGIMAGNAVSSLLPIYMKIVQVVGLVTEAGEFCCIAGLGHIFIMTAEAEVVILSLIIIIELIWKFPHEQSAEL